MRAIPLLLSAASLLIILGCGGSTSSPQPPAPATTLGYANPTGVPAASYQLTRNASLSTPSTHLVLDLYGPTSGTGSGVVLTLNLDTALAAWGMVSGTSPVANGSVFATNAAGAPVVKGKISGGTLQLIVTERGVATPKALSGPICQIAVDMKTGLATGSTVALTVDLAKSKVLNGTVQSLADLKIGTLTLNP
jgi:hypothetical protein